MTSWQQLWREHGAARLWAVPDPQVVELTARWKSCPSIRRVLDLGCGGGRHLQLLASQGFEVCGVDPTESGLDACRRTLAAGGLTADLLHAEMHQIPFPDAHFDAVIAFNSVYHGTADEVESMIQLIHRKLRPGGECFVTLPSRSNRMYGRGAAAGPHAFVSPGMFQQLIGNDGERGAVHYFSSREDVMDFFRQFQITALRHEELHLASAGREHGGPPTWVRVPRAFFWRVIARKPELQ